MEHEVQLPNTNRVRADDPEYYTFRRFIEPDEITARAQAIADHLLTNTPEDQPLLFLPVLHGALDFTLRVRNAITDINPRREPAIRALAASSYGNSMRGGIVRINYMPNLDNLHGHAGYLVEDIVDTGNTIRYVQPLLAGKIGQLGVMTQLQKRQGVDALLEESRPPKSGPFGQPLTQKPATREPISVNYAAFEICDDAFVIGEGLDYGTKGRGLSGVYYLVDPERPVPKYSEPDFRPVQ